MGGMEFLAWTFPLWRTRRLAWRASWLLPLWMMVSASVATSHRGIEALPAGLLAPALVMLAHAGGHLVCERLAGGTRAVMILGLMTEHGEALLPRRPWTYVLAAAGGPLANGALWLACRLALPIADPISAEFLLQVGPASGMVALINLLACAPLDGQRLWRGLLWSVLPMATAVSATMVLGFASAICLMLWGVGLGDLMLAAVGAMALVGMVHERRSVNDGYDPVFGVDPRFGGRSGTGIAGWWTRRQERWQQAQEDREQEVLDRLLTKVSEHGLPSLSADERRELQRISARQRERAS